MKKLVTKLFALLAFTLMFSCGPTVSTTKTTNKNLGAYETFAYLPNTNFEVPDNIDGQRDKVAKSIITAMNNNMMEAGYSIDTENPDMLVLLTTKFDKKKMREVDPVYATYPYEVTYPVSPYYENYYYRDFGTYGEFIGYDVDYSGYKVGTLIVDIIDRKTKQKLWTGTAEEAIYQKDTSEKIVAYVDAIFDEYPKL
ncbi:DUF4136 domain-containing protein [Costertonia aggregata]|uniref:DUF4136 domain-containing protein n=1 Tax=Costertonia aggregata TaxID=343403 RepID=A0A7H9ANH1_9FLAO|nr:DUF4136 domain-containing protein [Costertonia aggregata]QLG44986.1 DUF4136 domain-containing protein [Costertonia aggregata]